MIKMKKLGLFLVTVLVLSGVLMNLTACNRNNSSAPTGAEQVTKAPEKVRKTIYPGDLPDSTPFPTATDGPKPTESPLEPAPEATKPYTVGPFDQSLVSIVQSDTVKKAEKLTQKEIDSLVKKAVEYAGGLKSIVKDGDVVVLKPNLVVGNDYTLPGWRGKPLAVEVNGSNTDYRFTRAVAKLIREINPTGKIYVMEGSAGNTKQVMGNLRYTKEFIPEVDEFYALEEVSGAWKDMTSKDLVKVNLSNGYYQETYYINKQIFNADAFISLPTLKNHWDAGITGSIKNISIGATPANIYGTAPGNNGRNQMVDHNTINLHKWIADYYTCRPADFVIMDGLQGLENGPTPCFEINRCTDIKDSQKNMRMVIAGRDAVAVDTVETNLMNWDYTTIPYLNYLSDNGIGNTDARKITVVGNRTVAAVRTDFEGAIPKVAGKKLTDLKAPTLSGVTATFSGNTLKVTHKTNKDCVKTEIYIDGALVWKALDSASSSSFDVTGIAKGSHKIKVVSYDKFFNETSKTITATKKSSTNDLAKNGNYKATYASVAPQIDGVNDGIWNKAVWANIDQLWLGNKPSDTDFKGRYKMMWDENYVYYYVEITDDKISDTRSNPLDNYYEDDTLELFIDEDKVKEDHTSNYNAFAYHISTLGDAVDMDSTGKPRLYNDHITSKITSKGNVYTWEVKVKIYDKKYKDNSSSNVPVKLKEGKVMGFANAYCDADETGKREHFMGTAVISGADKNVAWKDTGVFGTLTLIK